MKVIMTLKKTELWTLKPYESYHDTFNGELLIEFFFS